MIVTLWVIAGLLAAAFIGGGTSLLLMGRERYRAIGESQHWVDDCGDGHLKFIGTVKILGCLGVILPGATGIAPILTPLAACGMVMFMTGAATTRRYARMTPRGLELVALACRDTPYGMVRKLVGGPIPGWMDAPIAAACRAIALLDDDPSH